MDVTFLKRVSLNTLKRNQTISLEHESFHFFTPHFIRNHALFWNKIGERQPSKKSLSHCVHLQTRSDTPILLPVQLNGIPILIWKTKKSDFSISSELNVEPKGIHISFQDIDSIVFERTAKLVSEEMKEEEERQRDARRQKEKKLDIERHELLKQQARLQIAKQNKR